MKKACNREIRSFHCASVMSVLIHSDLEKKLNWRLPQLALSPVKLTASSPVTVSAICLRSVDEEAKRQGGKKSSDCFSCMALHQEGLREGAEHPNGNLVRQIAPYDSADCRIHLFLGTQGKANRLVHVLPGTTVISDCWKAYDCLSEEGYHHLSVNHSLNFVDPDTGAHTNTIENTCMQVKITIFLGARA